MLGKAQKSVSCYSAPTWCCRVKRENYWNISLTLLAEISGAFSCLGNDRSHYVHGRLAWVNCGFESSAQADQMTLGAKISINLTVRAAR